MKAHKLLTTLLLISIFFTMGYSQGLYVKLGGGYAIGMNQQSMPFNETITEDENGITYHQFWYSLGKGITPELEIAYKFSENLGIAVNASYLYGTKNTAFNDYSGEENDYYYHYYSEMILISPSVLFEPLNGDFSPYTKLGGVFGSGKFYQKSKMGDSESLREFTGSYALGVNTALGMNYKLSSLLSVYAEINAMIMSWAPEKAKITKYIVEGEDELSDLP
ncbi:MAG: hypothetical protein R6V32_05455, partial [Bacteroidales bacterium]